MKKAYFDLFQYGKDYLSGVSNSETLDSVNALIEDEYLDSELRCDKIAHLLKNTPLLDLNQRNYDDVLPLTLAFMRQQVDVAKLLIDFGADIDVVNDKNNTLLMRLIADCHDYYLRVQSCPQLKQLLETIPQVIALGSNINHKNSQEETPLQLAICLNVPIIPLLLEKGVSLERSDLKVSNSNRCLYFAINNGDVYVLRLLLERYASATTGLYYLLNTVSFVNVGIKRAHELYFLLVEFGANLNQLHHLVANYGTNAMNQTIRLSLIRLMLEQGATRVAEFTNNGVLSDSQTAHLEEIKHLMDQPLPPLSLKRLCVMSFFKNPPQLPHDTSDLPNDVLNLLKGVDEEPDRSTLFFPRVSNSLGCVIQ